MIRRHLVLDVDVGIDDALMMLSLASDPRVEIVAVGSTHGNCSSEQAAINALRVLEAVGLDHVPVATGAVNPMPNPTTSPHVHGHDGLGDAGLPLPMGSPSGERAVDQLLRLSNERPGELDLLAVGCMTNLALALEHDPESLKRFRSVTILGGISEAPAPGSREFYDANVYHSPFAAERLFTSGTPVTVVPIDLSYQAVLEDRHLEAIRSGTTPQAIFAWNILPYYCSFYQQRLGRWTACMHDPIAGALFVDESLVTAEVHRPMVVEPYLERWRAIGLPDAAPDGRSPARIFTKADYGRFLDEFVASLLSPLT